MPITNHQADSPFQVVGSPIMNVLGLPERVITGPKGPAILVELITKDQVPLFTRHQARISIRLCRGILVDQVKVAQSGCDLSGPVDSSEVVPAEIASFVMGELVDERVPSEQGNEGETEDEDTSHVVKSSQGEDGPASIKLAIPLGIRVMQVIIRFRLIQPHIPTPRSRVSRQTKLVTDTGCQTTRGVVIRTPTLFAKRCSPCCTGGASTVSSSRVDARIRTGRCVHGVRVGG